MINKDKRSLVLLLCLGDGCLHYIKNNGNIYGGITIDHGIEQSDYQTWKAQLLSSIFNRNVKIRTGHRGKSVQVSVCMKRLRAWRKFTYPKGKKSIPKLLKFIRHNEMALAVWLMDDGYVEHSETKNNSRYAALRLFSCDQNDEQLKYIQEWLKSNFNANSKIRYQKGKKATYPFIKIDQTSSLLIWEKIREFVLSFKSMRYKFRYLEQSYQFRILQRTTEQKL